MNLAARLDGHLRNRPSHPAVIDGERVLAYRDLHRLVQATAARLAAHGIREGDVIGTCLDHSADHLIVVYALARLGAIVLPIDASLAAPERERIVATFAARFVVSQVALDGIGGAAAVRIDGSWQEASSAAPPPALPSGPDLPLLFALTSGSTGAPKGVLMTHEQQWQRCLGYAVNNGVSALDRYLAVLSPGVNVGRNCALAQTLFGGTVIVNRASTAAEFLALIERRAATWTFMIPAVLRRMATLESSGQPLLSRLRLVLAGTGPLLEPDRHRVVERVSSRLCITYGANDCDRFSMLPPGEVLARPDSAGRPLVGVAAEIVDDEDRPLPAGMVGRIRFRGPGFPVGYWRNPEATARSFRDGWFYPGDLAAIDAEGYIHLKGRTDGLINLGGLKVYPPDVEAVLHGHPDIVEAAVIGWQNGSEQLPVAIVVTRSTIDEAALKAFAGRHLAAYKVPVRILRVDSLPKTAAGKVDRSALKRSVERLARQGRQG